MNNNYKIENIRNSSQLVSGLAASLGMNNIYEIENIRSSSKLVGGLAASHS